MTGKHTPLYEAVNSLVAHIGHAGSVDSRHPAVDAVMTALAAVDAAEAAAIDAAEKAGVSLVRTRVDLKFTGSTGYQGSTTFSSEFERAKPPHLAFVGAIEELSRLLALSGHEAEARAAVDVACGRVADWRKGQTK